MLSKNNNIHAFFLYFSQMLLKSVKYKATFYIDGLSVLNLLLSLDNIKNKNTVKSITICQVITT